MYQNQPTKCLTGEVRLSYCYLNKPRDSMQPGGTAKYSVTLLIPKTDAATINDMQSAFQSAYEMGVSSKWNGARPAPKSIFHDGDGLRPSGVPFGDECKGHVVITASSSSKPHVVGQDNITCDLAPEDVYSGMYARVTVNFYPYDTAGGKGVGCGLGNVMKTRDGEPLGGASASAASDFADVGQAATPSAFGQGFTPAPPTYPAQYAQTVDPISGLPVGADMPF